MLLNVPILIYLNCLSAREGEQGESEGRRVVRYPDAHQLFVGNVPHDVDKTELKEFFERKLDWTMRKRIVGVGILYVIFCFLSCRIRYSPGAKDQQWREAAKLWLCGV